MVSFRVILSASAVLTVGMSAGPALGASRQYVTSQSDAQGGPRSYRYPKWSMDGTSIVCEVTIHDRVPQIYLVSRNRTSERKLTTRGGFQPTGSPDGKQIAFWREAEGRLQVNVLSTEEPIPEQSVRTLVTVDKPVRPLVDLAPAWSPNGSEIAFVAPDGICFYNVGNGKLQHTGVQGEKPAWSPDSKQLAYIHNSRIYVMTAAGIETHEIISQSDLSASPFASTRRIQSVSWSRRNRLVFDDRFRMYTAAPDGSDIREIRFPAERMLAYPSWSPDGSEIVCCNPNDLGKLKGQFDIERTWSLFTGFIER